MTKNQSMFIIEQEKPTQTKKLLVGKAGLLCRNTQTSDTLHIAGMQLPQRY